MTEVEWSNCTDVEEMLDFVQNGGRTSDRKLRLFAVTCCRRVGDLLNNSEREAVILMERFLEGLADESERAAAFEAVKQRAPDIYGREDCPVAQDLLDRDARFAAEAVLLLLPADRHLFDSEKKAWCNLFRDIFAPLPFREPRIEAAWLQWSGGIVKTLAQAIYDERSLPDGTLEPARLAVLADALEEAGCGNEEILFHLRQQGQVHVRGCWVIDLLLRKA